MITSIDTELLHYATRALRAMSTLSTPSLTELTKIYPVHCLGIIDELLVKPIEINRMFTDVHNVNFVDIVHIR